MCCRAQPWQVHAVGAARPPRRLQSRRAGNPGSPARPVWFRGSIYGENVGSGGHHLRTVGAGAGGLRRLGIPLPGDLAGKPSSKPPSLLAFRSEVLFFLLLHVLLHSLFLDHDAASRSVSPRTWMVLKVDLAVRRHALKRPGWSPVLSPSAISSRSPHSAHRGYEPAKMGYFPQRRALCWSPSDHHVYAFAGRLRVIFRHGRSAWNLTSRVDLGEPGAAAAAS